MSKYNKDGGIINSAEEAIAVGIGASEIARAVARKTDDISRQLKVPTHPVYDSTNWPDEATRGQVVRDINDPEVLWIYGEDDIWHKIGGDSIWSTLFPLDLLNDDGLEAFVEWSGVSGDWFAPINNLSHGGEPDPSDGSYPQNWYLSNRGHDLANRGWILPFGPRGSLWGPTITGERGSSFGRITYALSGPYEEPVPPCPLISSSALHPWIDIGTFEFSPSNTNYPAGLDTRFYNVRAMDSINGTPGFFIIDGQEGDEFTSFVQEGQAAVINGGPGLYYINFRVNGKRAGSSGTNMRLTNLEMRRFFSV
jgi:hypothetical protein